MEIFNYQSSFRLESGVVLPRFHLAYTTLGKINAAQSNVVWVFHALTANSDPSGWWNGLVGESMLFNPHEHFIICVNMPGSCYGSINPLDVNPESNGPYFHTFPLFTTRDMIRCYQRLKISLRIERIFAGLGGSMGGQQLLQWAIEEPGLFEHIIPIATNAIHSPWAIAFNASQRMCIEGDITWKDKSNEAGINGMKTARSLALLSYRNYETYTLNQSETEKEVIENFKSDSYQRYQGEKLARRFNAFSYYFLSKSMDAHNVGRGRVSAIQALQAITAKTIVIGIQSDILFPVSEQAFLAKHIPDASLAVIKSSYGHDGFLLEFDQIAAILRKFLSVENNAASNDAIPKSIGG